MYKLSNDEICFILILAKNGIKNIEDHRKTVEIKKDILQKMFQLDSLNPNSTTNTQELKEKIEKEIEENDEIFHSYLDEKEQFLQGIVDKMDSLFEIIKENDTESYDKAEYFINDTPLDKLKNKKNSEQND